MLNGAVTKTVVVHRLLHCPEDSEDRDQLCSLPEKWFQARGSAAATAKAGFPMPGSMSMNPGKEGCEFQSLTTEPSWHLCEASWAPYLAGTFVV